MPRPLIIERPELQTRAQRYGYASLTFVCWFLWLYLFVPLLSFVAWVLGANLVYQVLLQDLQIAELTALLRSYGAGILALTGIYLSWAVTSWLRFRGVDRRRLAPAAGARALAASHHLSMEELARLREGHRLVVGTADLERMFGEGREASAGVPRSDAA